MNLSFKETVIPLITQRPEEDKASDPSYCPQCNSQSIKIVSRSSTLIGGGDGTIDNDPNHVWEQSECCECFTPFIRQYKRGNVWYTDLENKLYSGLPNCFESFIYTCSVCAKPVSVKYTQEGITPTYSLGTTLKPYKRHYRTFYGCFSSKGCGRFAETEQDYYI